MIGYSVFVISVLWLVGMDPAHKVSVNKCSYVAVNWKVSTGLSSKPDSFGDIAEPAAWVYIVVLCLTRRDPTAC